MSDSDSLQQTTTLEDGGDRRSAAPILDRGNRLGRYAVLDWIGGGAMGVVYAAYDPKLDRKVALKILRAEAFASGKAEIARRRLLREAQALARLAHPNVVTVHDVGLVDGQIFIAMELIDGRDLKHWLKQERPGWRRIVEIFVQAGTGLMAAHRAGLTHRDFKPANVTLGHDGRVRVVDFGLAISRRPATDSERTTHDTPASAHRLTHPGLAAGTPAYMAPERHDNPAGSERSDQYSFCVALYEALYLELPFAGTDRADLFANQRAGRLRTAPDDSGIPARLRKVVLRGLAADPADRYASMEELLAALAPHPRRRRLAATLATAMMAVGALAFMLHQQSSRPCQAAEQHLEGIWDTARKAEIHATFSASPQTYAEDLWRSTESLIDRYTGDWISMRTEACEATHLRGEQSEQLLDLRIDCLDRRLRELAMLTELFRDGADETIENAWRASTELSSLDSCADIRALTAVISPPTDERARRDTESLRAAVAKAKARLDLGQLKQASASVLSIETQLTALDYPPAEAEALHTLGEIAQALDDFPTAESRYLAAAAKADQGRHDEVRLRAAIGLVWLLGHRQSEREAARDWLEIAQGVLERLERPPAHEISWHQSNAILRLRAGDYSAAAEAAAGAVELSRSYNGPWHRQTWRSLSTLGNAQYRQGRFDEAYATFSEVAAIRTRTLGATHPEVAYSQQTLGELLRHLGRYEEARAVLTEALVSLERIFGASHSRVAIVIDSLGNTYSSLGQPDKALGLLRRGLEIWRDTNGDDSSKVAASLNNIGLVLRNQDRFQEAEEHLRRALAIHQHSDGPEHPKTLIPRINLGALLFEIDRPEKALVFLRPAREAAVRDLGEANPTSLHAGLILGQVELALGQLEKGLQSIATAFAIIEREGEAGRQPQSTEESRAIRCPDRRCHQRLGLDPTGQRLGGCQAGGGARLVPTCRYVQCGLGGPDPRPGRQRRTGSLPHRGRTAVGAA